MNLCPPPDELERLLDEKLDEDGQRSLSLHVDACPQCQQALERLTLDSGPSLQCLSRVKEANPSGSDGRTEFLHRLENHKPPPRGIVGDPTGIFARSPRSDKPSWPVVPGYQIVKELGRGGMGIVYLARQSGLGRFVALKMLRAGSDAQVKERERFSQEAMAVARLRHPHIVQIFDVGEFGGVPYLALEYIEGGSLADRLCGNPQPLQPTVRLVETLARAVHHAHQQGIVHRDLKPANILLENEGRSHATDQEATTEGRLVANVGMPSQYVKITDFGLAKHLDDPSTRTRSGDIVGTPCYMAPEQATGTPQGIGPATDVYALGAILYEMLTGRPPFKGETAVDTVVLLLHQEPVRPCSLRPDLPRDLETICLTCLAKEPGRRYSSAEALANDLARYRGGKPISARPVGPLERAAKWARRHPLPASLMASLILVGLLGFVGVSWQWRKAAVARDTVLEEKRQKEEERQQAEEARAETAEQRRQARIALYGSRIAQSQLSWRVNDLEGARLALDRCRPAPGVEERRGWEWHYLRRLYQSELFGLAHEQPGSGGAVAHSPRGGVLASVVAGASDTAQDGELRTWEADTGKILLVKAIPGALHRLVFSPDGKRLALAGTDGSVTILDASDGRTRLHWKAHPREVSCLAFSPDGKSLATGSWDRTANTWDAKTGKHLQVFRGHTRKVQDIAFDAKGGQLATASWDGTVRVWDVPTGRLEKTLDDHKSPVFCVAYSPDGRLLASASQNGNVKIWEGATGRAVQSVTGLAGAVLNVAFSPDGRYLAYGGSDASVRIWNIESGVERMVFRGHTAPVECVNFSPNGQRLVSSSPKDGGVMVWDLTRHTESGSFSRTGSDVEAVGFRRGGRQLLSVTAQGMLQRWDRATGVLLAEHTLAMRSQGISLGAVASFSPDGERLAARGFTGAGQVRVWDTNTGKPTLSLDAHSSEVACVRFSGDGRYLGTVGSGQFGGKTKWTIRVWDAATGKRLATWTAAGRIFNLAFHAGNEWLAWSGADGAVGLVHWATGLEGPVLHAHKGNVFALAFSPDGRLLASAGEEDRMIRIQNVTPDGTGGLALGEMRKIPAPRLLCELAFSPVGGRLGTARLAGITRDLVKLWDPESKLEVLTLRGAPQRYWDAPFTPRVVFSPDGTGLVGTNWDESVSLWEAENAGDVTSPEAKRRNVLLADARAAFWHIQEAEHCLEHRNPSAARFHLQWVGDAALPPPLQHRKERLQKDIAEAPPTK